MAFKDKWKIWNQLEYNFFRNSMDAVGGFVVLVIFPFISLLAFIIQVITQSPASLFSYTFPMVTICASATYDILGRWKNSAFLRFKLLIRGGLVFLAFVGSLILSLASNMSWWHLIPIAFLLFSGFLLLNDMRTRWKISWTLLFVSQGGVNTGV